MWEQVERVDCARLGAGGVRFVGLAKIRKDDVPHEFPLGSIVLGRLRRPGRVEAVGSYKAVLRPGNFLSWRTRGRVSRRREI